MNEVLWSPPAERVASSNLAAFAARVGKSALANPAALEHFRDRPELRS
jgi:hypothetical protein